MTNGRTTLARRCARWGAGLASLSLFLAASWAPDDAISVKLANVRVSKSAYQLVAGLEAEIPGRAFKARVGQATWLFFDLDSSGGIEPGGVDGLALEGYPFIVPLPSLLLLAEGQCTLRFEKRKLLLTPDPSLEKELFPDASFLTEARIRGGLAPVSLDVRASTHARQHCEYMQLNQITIQSSGLDVHHEEPGKPGYTKEGAEAAKIGVILFGDSLREDLEAWYATAYHGAAVLDPRLRTVGLARRHGISMLFPCDAAADVDEPIVHPPDGATGVPLAFSQGGEVPNPVPGTRLATTCGYPVVVRLPEIWSKRELLRFELVDKRGDAVEGSASAPSRPANEAWPTNSGCAFFIPKKPLAPGKRYTATLLLERMEHPIVWSFTTGEE